MQFAPLVVLLMLDCGAFEQKSEIHGCYRNGFMAKPETEDGD